MKSGFFERVPIISIFFCKNCKIMQIWGKILESVKNGSLCEIEPFVAEADCLALIDKSKKESF